MGFTVRYVIKGFCLTLNGHVVQNFCVGEGGYLASLVVFEKKKKDSVIKFPTNRLMTHELKVLSECAAILDSLLMTQQPALEDEVKETSAQAAFFFLNPNSVLAR